MGPAGVSEGMSLGQGRYAFGALERIEVDVVDLPSGPVTGRREPERDGVGADERGDVRQRELELTRRLPRARAGDRPSVEDAENAEQAVDDDRHLEPGALGASVDRKETKVPVAGREAHRR